MKWFRRRHFCDCGAFAPLPHYYGERAGVRGTSLRSLKLSCHEAMKWRGDGGEDLTKLAHLLMWVRGGVELPATVRSWLASRLRKQTQIGLMSLFFVFQSTFSNRLPETGSPFLG